MMKGKNEIRVNHATMIGIVQYWLDNKFTNKNEHSPHVDNVVYDANKCMFVVKTGEADK